jgi:hypothetical protein
MKQFGGATRDVSLLQQVLQDVRTAVVELLTN